MLNITLDQLEIFLYVKTRHDRASWANYKCRFLKVQKFFENKPFTDDNVGIYLLSLKNLSTGTVCAYFDMLEYICRILGVDYIHGYKRPKVINRKKFVLSPEEMKKVLEYSYRLNYRMSVIIEIAMRQGLRFNEIRQLLWTDLIDNELTLRDTKAGTTQTAYLPDDLVKKIRKIKNGKLHIFANSNGLFSNHGANWYLKKILKECNITKPMTFHDLRHTAATDLANKDVNMYVIKEFMRHKDIHTTEKYLHILPAKLLEAAKKHSLAVKNWTKEDLIKEVVKFERTILDTNFKPSIEYSENEVIIKITY